MQRRFRLIVREILSGFIPTLYTRPAWQRSLIEVLYYYVALHKNKFLRDCLKTPKPNEQPIESLDHLINKTLSADIRFDKRQLDRIPKNSPVIIVSNHPTGILDGVITLHCLVKIPNFDYNINVVTGNFNISFFPNFTDYFLPVDLYHKKSFQSVKAIVQATRNGKSILLYPSGRAARPRPFRVKEFPWNPSFLKIARRYNIPIVPLKLNAKNSLFLNVMSVISETLASALTFREADNAKGRAYSLEIGEPINIGEEKGIKRALSAFYGPDFPGWTSDLDKR